MSPRGHGGHFDITEVTGGIHQGEGGEGGLTSEMTTEVLITTEVLLGEVHLEALLQVTRTIITGGPCSLQ